MKIIKRKPLVLLASLLLVAAIIHVETASSQTIARLYLDPAIAFAASGESFEVNVTVASVNYLYDWQVNMSFDSNVLRFVNVTEGDFLADQPEGTFGSKRVEDDWAVFGWTTLGEFEGRSGSGWVATVEFEVLAEGESLLKFEGLGTATFLEAQTSPNPPPVWRDIEFTAQDGLFMNTLAPPVADFTYSPEFPGIGQVVTFDASTSSVGTGLEIVEYYWDFNDGTNTTVTTPTIEHTYTTGGTYTVSLTVIDNATASSLVQLLFDTTDMPRVWYDLYATKEKTLDITQPHNVAVTGVTTSSQDVTVGETVSISVTVLNKGTETEGFAVTAYYDTNEIDTEQVVGLASGEEETLVFDWDTSGVAEGDYQIKAVASTVEGEVTVNDNEFIDGTVTVNAASDQIPLLLVGGVIGIAIVAAVILVFFMRRRGSSPA